MINIQKNVILKLDFVRKNVISWLNYVQKNVYNIKKRKIYIMICSVQKQLGGHIWNECL